ncbi:MAG: DUF1581 domain-containing protein, partial [Planctomycetaceae bacterium]
MSLKFAVALGLLIVPHFSLAADEVSAPDAELAAEIEKERKIAERFLTLLERNPREGTSLDKAYGFFVEQGKLDELVATYRQRVEADEKDGAAWMILGLIESRRGNDAPAIEALAKASGHRQDDAMAAYYLGRAYSVAGRVDKAIAAFEEAVSRKPARADLPPIFAELGRLHQRAGRAEDATQVWDRLEAAFPGDERVKAEIAAILEEEGQAELALQRYDDLAKSAEDEYRKVTYALKASALKSRLGKQQEAVVDLEQLLSRLDPDDWLFREARRGIEQAFLRTDDLDGLAAYYETWIEKHPEDVAAMSRLAGVLGDLGRAEDARGWFDKATKLAPSDARLRRTYIEALRRGGKDKEAIAQFEALDKASPNDPDVLRDWGTVWLEDKSLPEAERKAKAADVWKRLVAARPKDAVATAQVADWFRQAEMSDEALALYAKAVELAPDDPRYLEYLGEYQHQLGKKKEAVATWKQLAAGKNRTTENLVRLAEVFAGFGYKDEAIATFREADDNDLGFADRLRFAELLRDAELYDESLAQIAKAEPLAESDEERQNALAARIETDQAANRIEDRIAELQKLAADQPDAKTSLTLALYLNAIRDTAGATAAAREAVELDPRSIAAQATLAKLADDSGQLLVAAESYRRLAALDRRGRTEYLKQVAGLEQRLGKANDAMATAREVLASAPGSPDAYAFYAELCFRLGKTDDGLDALRRAARLAPSDAGPTLTLAAALAEQFRTDEAVELYWQAFDKSEAFDDRAPIVSRLAELYLRTNRFDELLKRLERTTVGGDDRATKLLVAAAHQAVGDLVRAGETLQSLLSESPRDTQLLSRLSQLAEQDHDYEAALRYQRELVELAPEDRQEKARLAQLYLAADDVDAGPEFWDELLESDLDAVETLSLIDALLAAEKYDDALRLVDRKLRAEPENWELIYRRAFGLLNEADKQDEADETFRNLLALDLPDDAESAKTAALKKKRSSSTTAATSSSGASYNPSQFPAIVLRTQAAYQAMAVFGISDQNVYGATPSGRSLGWTPNDFGAARVAALGWLGHYDLTSSGKKQGDALTPFHQALRDAAMAENSSKRARLDWYYAMTVDRYMRQRSRLADLSSISTAQEEAAKRLAEVGDSDGAWAYLTATRSRRSSTQEQLDPLPKDELELLLQCFERVRHEEAGYYSTLIPNLVAQELERAGRKDEAKRLVQETLAAVDDPQELSMVFSMAVSANDLETVNQIYDRLESMPPDQLASAANTSSVIARLMRTLWDEGKHDEAIQLFDRQMALTARRLEAPQRRSSGSSTQRISGRFGLSFWKKGGVQDHIIVDGAELNEYVGMQEFTLLRNVYEFHKEADDEEKEQVNDFVAHLEKQIEGATGRKAAFAHLSLAVVRGWQEKPEESLVATRAAVEAVPEDHSLRLTLARKLQAAGDLDGALAVIDAVEPLDATELRDRELLALDLAAAQQQIDRAKTAATRLFGLRLDAQQQLRLANVMQQVGMGEQAEAVLARLRTQGGSTLSTQIELLRHYRGKGADETAIEIAREIIRRTKSNPSGNRRTVDDGHREEAVRLLKESGQLDTLIADAKRQAARSPNSVEAQQQLAEYYAAVGKNEEAAAVLQAVSDRRPKDYDLKYQLAGRVAAMGRASAAVDLYTAALKGKPELASNNFYEVDRVFTQARRGEDMLKLLGEIPLTGNSMHYAMNSISNKLGDAKLKPAALAALDKLLKENPGQQAELLQNIHDQTIWDDPKIADYALDMVKTDGAQLTWPALQRSTSISGGGKVRTLFNNVARAAAGDGKRDEFHKAVAAIVEKHPDWQPGQALLAISEASQGKHDEARKRLRAILDDEKSPIPTQATWSLAVELQPYEPLRAEAIEMCERAASSSDRSSNDYQFTPTALLVELYGAGNRKAEAREILLSKGMEPGENRYSDPSYAAYSEMRHYTSVGDKLLDLDYPIDALRLYDRHAADPRRVAAAQQQGSYALEQLKRNRKRALDAIDASDIAVYLAAAAKEPANAGEPALDLMLSLGGGTEFEDMAVESIIATTLAKLSPSAETQESSGTINRTHKTVTPSAKLEARKPVEARVPPIAAIEASLHELLLKRPQDASVQVVAALVAFQKGDLAAANAACEKALAAASVESDAALKAGDKGQSDRMSPAALGLWIVAREAAKHDETRPLAVQLAAKAVAASREMSDRRWTMAMLLERGAVAFEGGDRKAAEAAWSELLDLILPPQQEQPEGDEKADRKSPTTTDEPTDAAPAKKTSSTGRRTIGRPTVAVALVLSTLVAQSGPKAQTNLRPGRPPAASPKAAQDEESHRFLSLEQVTQALELAELAARRDMTDLSIRAVRESLGNGRPVDIVSPNTATTVVMSVVQPGRVNDVTRIDGQIADRLLRLDAAWREQQADPNVVFETLFAIVLPAQRATENFPYLRPLSEREADAPQSAGRLLVDWAGKAGKLDVLAQRLTERKSDGTANAELLVLRTLTAYASGDAATASHWLGSLEELVTNAPTSGHANLVCHAALPGLSDRQVSEPAAEALNAAMQNFAASNSEQPFGWLTQRLAEHELRLGRAEAAEKRLEEYLTVLDRVYSRYSGDYPTRRRREVLQNLAGMLGRHGRSAKALEYLEEVGELSSGVSAEQTPATSPAFTTSLTRGFAAGDVSTYERLKTWTLPAEGRKALRMWTALAPAAEPPKEFAVPPDPCREAFDVELDPPVTGTAAALVSLAKRHGKLVELMTEVDRAAEANVENAAMLSVLAHVAAGSGDEATARLHTITEEFFATPPEKIDFQVEVPELLLVAFAAATVPELRPDAARIAHRIENVGRNKGHGLHPSGRFLVAMCQALDAGLNPGDVLLRDDFGPWRVGRMPRPQDRNNARIPAVWVLRKGVARQAAGSESDTLAFRYPLAGSFDVIVDAWDGSYAESFPGFNGLSYEAYAWNKKAAAYELGHWGGGEASFPNKQAESYNTYRIRVRPGEVRCFVNGDEMHVDTAATAAAPFLTLNCFFSRSGWFRGAKIEGDPVIPREVHLLDGDRLDGWVEYFYGETKPARPDVQAGGGVGRQDDGGEPFWNVTGGVLTARTPPTSRQFQQSWIYYHRPLWDDESIEYEFFHDGGHGVAHPSLGRLAFLLEPDA